MKETRFIELLNLYVDQQLTAAEATELEAELQSNPSRRKTYQQYCRMQKACAMLFEHDRQAAPSSAKLSRALAQADRKVVAFPAPRRLWLQRGLWAGGFAAAAACAVFVFVHRPVSSKSDVAAEVQAPAVSVAAVEAPAPAPVSTVSIPPADPQLNASARLVYSVLPVRQLVPMKVVVRDAGASAGEELPDFAWMRRIKLSPMRPVSAEELLAGAKTQNQQLTNGAFLPVSPRVGSPGFENAAFQYQKGN